MSDLCNPMDWSPPGSSVHGISQARILEWAAIPSSQSRNWIHVSWISSTGRQILWPLSHLVKALHILLQTVKLFFKRAIWNYFPFPFACMLSHVQLFAAPWTVACYGSSGHGILQARVLEWVAIPFSRGSSWPRDRTEVSYIAGRFFLIWATRFHSPVPLSLCYFNTVCHFTKYFWNMV